MDPNYVASVWPFDRPSRHDGFCVVRIANLTGLSQYPVFKVQAAADSLHILRFCPPLTARRAFGGKEIQYAVADGLSTGSLDFFWHRRSGQTTNSEGTKNASPVRAGGASIIFTASLRP